MDTKSVFVLVECFTNKNGEAELYQVSQPNGGELIVNPVRSFGDCGKHGDQGKGRYSWIFPPRRVLISHWFKGKLYMLLPVWETDLGTGTSTKWLSMGRTFDPHHKLTGKFKAPDSLEPWGALISAYDNLYYLAQPKLHGELSSPFQCYHPGSDTWKDLPRIPPDLHHNLHDTVAGYAVCSGHILVSISNRLLAYDVHDKKWHCVSKPSRFFGISGRAVVLGDYIYAVDSMSDLVCEITFDCTDYTLRAHVFLEGLATFVCDFKSDSNIAYLGTNKFLFVKCGIRADNCQSLFITVFSIVGEPGSRSIKTLAKHVYDAEYTRHTNVIFFPKSVFTPDCPCSESEGKDPMAQKDTCGGHSTGGQISETETDAKAEGRGIQVEGEEEEEGKGIQVEGEEEETNES
ncbi:unnamed protein product [Malus baccata var. baccata]